MEGTSIHLINNILANELEKRKKNTQKLTSGIFGPNYEVEMTNLISALKDYVTLEEEKKINTEKVLIRHYE